MKLNTFIIPVLNNYKGLYRLLDTLKRYTPPNYNVIVVHNGFYLRKQGDPYKSKAKAMTDIWIDPYRNMGFGKAMNMGIKLAQTEFVTCANDDVEIIYPGWWREVMQVFEEDETVMGFNPHSPCNKKHTGERYIQYEYKKDYDEADINRMKEIFKNEREYVGACTYFTIFKKKLFDEIGYFDESFGQGSGEDYDLNIRAARAGYKIKGGSRVMVWHWWGATKDNMPEGDGNTNYNLIAKANQLLENKWGPHIDKDPNGWTVSGKGGPEEPLDKDTIPYKEKGKWYVEVDY